MTHSVDGPVDVEAVAGGDSMVSAGRREDHALLSISLEVVVEEEFLRSLTELEGKVKLFWVEVHVFDGRHNVHTCADHVVVVLVNDQDEWRLDELQTVLWVNAFPAVLFVVLFGTFLRNDVVLHVESIESLPHSLIDSYERLSDGLSVKVERAVEVAEKLNVIWFQLFLHVVDVDHGSDAS